MIDNETKKGAALNALIALIMTALFIAGTILLYDYTYGVVDDPYITIFLNGGYTGTPDAHVVYIKYPLAWILSSLFRVIPQINWHFLLLVGCFAVCYFVVNFRICSNVRKFGSKLILMILFMLCFWLCMAKMALSAHYSMCAAVLAATGIFYFATIKERIRTGNLILNYAAVLLMLWTAYALRARTLFMLLPLAGAVFIYQFFREKPAFQKKNVIRFLSLPAILFIGLGGMELMHNANYKSEAWQEFLTFNDARTTLYDFYGLPEYEKNKEMYASLNISEAREYMYEKYYLEFQDGVPEDALTQIADYRVAESAETLPAGKRIAETLKDLPHRLTMKTYAPVNWICAAAFLLLLLFAVLKSKWRLMWALILGIITSLIPWIWMIYMGKPVPRVTMGIWAADLLFITALLIDNRDEIEKLFGGRKAVKAVAAAVLAAAFLAGNITGYAKIVRPIEKYVQSGRVRSQLEQWCESRPENLYICESEIINGLGFDEKEVDNSLQNLYWPGGWTAKLVLSRDIWDRYGFSDVEKAIVKEDNIYIIAFAETDMSYWTDFYRENYPDVTLKTVEQPEIGQREFKVYQLQER